MNDSGVMEREPDVLAQQRRHRRKRWLGGLALVTLIAVAAYADSGCLKMSDGTGTAAGTYGGPYAFTVSGGGGTLMWDGLEYSWDPDKCAYCVGATIKTCVKFSPGGAAASGTWSWDNEGSGNLDSGTYTRP